MFDLRNGIGGELSFDVIEDAVFVAVLRVEERKREEGEDRIHEMLSN
jgi:hypothetical protein